MKTPAAILCIVALGSCIRSDRGDRPDEPRDEVDAGTGADGGPDARDGGPASDAGSEMPPADGGLHPDADAGVFLEDMALTVADGQLALLDGTPVDVRGGISCCGGGYGWPLFDEAWASLVASNDGNFLHARLGPFLTTGNGETDWAVVGGGYVEVDGRADLSQFNEVFWSRVRALVSHARSLGLYVEVDLIDGWSVKHCQAADLPGYSAWESAFNVQGHDGCTDAGAGAVVLGSVHEQWIRKVVAETGGFDNVLYQDGNEVGLVQSYSTEWTRSMHDIVRDEEAAHGFTRHLFATNAGSDAAHALTEVDYIELHQQTAPSAAQCTTVDGHRKPCMVNEYNPSPPLTPTEFKQRLCAARAQGTAFWYWRHSQSDAQLLESLSLLGEPCSDAPALDFPLNVPEEGFIDAAASSTDTDPAVDAVVNATMAALTGCNVGTSCDLSAFPGGTPEQKCQSWFDAVNADLRAQGFNAGQHEAGHTDEIAVSDTGCTGRWYGYHVCNYGGPLVVWNPGARRGWWTIDPAYCE